MKKLTQEEIETLRAANAEFESSGGRMEDVELRWGLKRYSLTNFRRSTTRTAERCEPLQIDLMLEILWMVLDGEPVELTQGELADICGCSTAAIFTIEKAAIKKLQRAFGRKDRMAAPLQS